MSHVDELLNTAPCGYLSFDDDGKVISINATLLDLLGYELGEVRGRHIERLLPVASRIFYQTHFFPLLKLNGRVEEVYFSLRADDKTDIPVLVNAVRRDGTQAGAPVAAPAAAAAVTHCIMMPMRQRNQYEDEILRAKKAAEEATRAKDEFLAVVSHELRTPLTAILGWARLLRTGTINEEIAARALETIDRNAELQARLIEDILDFSRIISGKIRLDVGPVEPAAVTEAALDVVRPAAAAKSIRLQPVLDPRAGPVTGDPERLQQVLCNLLTNAIKFTPKGGRVQVRLSRVNSNVEITVSDTGQGISAEFLPYVFERFRQADHTSTRRHAGLGLGMAITKHLVELHGGTIKAESPGEGRGATFILRLPVTIVHNASHSSTAAAPTDRQTLALEAAATTTVPSPPPAPAESVRLDGARVLVVDDEPDARELLVTILTRSGAGVATAGSAADAFDKLEQLRPDLMVSDIEMPDEDGYTLIRRVRAAEVERGLRRLPAIALTAHARPSDRLQALAAGYELHIPKPVEPIELVLAIANLTNRRQDLSAEPVSNNSLNPTI